MQVPGLELMLCDALATAVCPWSSAGKAARISTKRLYCRKACESPEDRRSQIRVK